ncbi:MAG: MCP four helix bundle domain-containing protein [Burkholderiales bacterium]|nr:MCP four helix bundle domain-containing protein [Burkholderiales bacterium]
MGNKQWTVRAQLAGTFGVTLAMLVGIAVIGVQGMAAVQGRLDEVVNVYNHQKALVATMRAATNQVAIATRNIALLEAADLMSAEERVIAEARQDYERAKKELIAMLPQGDAEADQQRLLIERVDALQASMRAANDRFLELGLANRAQEATAVLMGQIAGPQKERLATLDQLAKVQDAAADEKASEARNQYAQSRAFMLGASIAAILLALACGAWMVRRLMRQLGGEPAYAAEVANAIAAGDLGMAVKVADGMPTTSLLAAMQRMQTALSGVVAGIREGADAIATGTTQIATGNADLSQRTEEQASNLQQTAASMEQLTVTVQTNADSARQAAQLAAQASERVRQGTDAVVRVQQTMDGITGASQRIGEIIGVIDGIAFQTNILALNAAVEAARAGENGRGFAVVAGEVRTLAQRSAEAAKEIKQLIQDSSAKVAQGGEQVSATAATMEEILRSVGRVNDLMGDIDAATAEQSQGISQVGTAVSQLDQVTQQNAALVEEAAAAADSLRAQADRLVQSVAVFRLAGSAA